MHYCEYSSKLGSIIDFSSVACSAAFLSFPFGPNVCALLFFFSHFLLCFFGFFRSLLSLLFSHFPSLAFQITFGPETRAARACKRIYVRTSCLWSDSCQLLWWHSYQLYVCSKRGDRKKGNGKKWNKGRVCACICLACPTIRWGRQRGRQVVCIKWGVQWLQPAALTPRNEGQQFNFNCRTFQGPSAAPPAA